MRENRNVVVGRKTAAMLDEDGRVPEDVIEMRSGAFVDPFDLDPELVFIEDVAGGLARISRFTGCSDSYGAEHALIVTSILAMQGHPPLTCLHGEMHDAHEAYLNDVPKPIKRRPEYAFYREACARAQDVIYSALGLPSPTGAEHTVVKHADRLSLFIEARRGLPSRGERWKTSTAELLEEADAFSEKIPPMGWDHVTLGSKFLMTYKILRREAGGWRAFPASASAASSCGTVRSSLGSGRATGSTWDNTARRAGTSNGARGSRRPSRGSAWRRRT